MEHLANIEQQDNSTEIQVALWLPATYKKKMYKLVHANSHHTTCTQINCQNSSLQMQELSFKKLEDKRNIWQVLTSRKERLVR